MPQPTPFDAILVQSRDLFRDRLCEAVTHMFDGADGSLSELAEKTKDEDLQKRYLDARDLALANREVIESHWVELLGADGESRDPAKLHYVSPMKSHFLFVDRKGKKIFECSRSILARRIKLGELALLDGEPDASLFDRIMDGLFGKLRAAAPA